MSMSKDPSKMPKFPGDGVDKPPAQEQRIFDRGVSWQTFLWNPKTKEFLGRTAGSWGRVTAFYLIFYAFLAGYFAFMMTVFYHTIDEERPTYTAKGGESVLKAPGIAMRPDYRPSEQKAYRLMEYDPNDSSTYSPYVDSIKDLLSKYTDSKNQASKNNCQVGKTCGYDLSQLTANAEVDLKNYNWGYDTSSPTVILKLNKVFDWIPTVYPYDDKRLPEELHTYISEMNNTTDLQEKMIWVWCEADKSQVSIDYRPYPGFPASYYPFKNQPGFLSPLVAVTIQNLPGDQERVRVSCKTYAENSSDQTLQFDLKRI